MSEGLAFTVDAGVAQEIDASRSKAVEQLQAAADAKPTKEAATIPTAESAPTTTTAAVAKVEDPWVTRETCEAFVKGVFEDASERAKKKAAKLKGVEIVLVEPPPIAVKGWARVAAPFYNRLAVRLLGDDSAPLSETAEAIIALGGAVAILAAAYAPVYLAKGEEKPAEQPKPEVARKAA